MERFLEKAVKNNALWCDAVCKAQRLPGEFLKMMWVNKNKVPQFYPNAITLLPVSSEKDRKLYIQLVNSLNLTQLSVKDSYDDLDLSQNGFKTLFNANWIAYDNLDFEKDTDISGWKNLKLKADFEKWTNSWRHMNNIDQNIFADSLFYSKDVHFLAKSVKGEIIAGAILFRANGVISISNVFFDKKYMGNCWLECIKLIREKITLLPIVGYENENNLKKATLAGFKKLNALVVWEK